MNSQPKVFITRALPQEAMDKLKTECQLEVNTHNRALTRAELEEGIQNVDAVISLLTDNIDAELLDLNPDLQVIANYAVGYDNIDVEACTERGIKVSNTPGVLTETTADLTWALLMAVARRVVEADKFTRSGKYESWGPMLMLGSDVYGKRLGIIGLGRIGKAVARRAAGFNMDVIYYNRSRKEEFAAEQGIEFRNFESLLVESDFISINTPLTPETKRMIGEREFKKMKNSAYIINTSRGAVIDEKALLHALRTGEIAGAGIDVYEDEPKLTPGLAEQDNLVMLPHIGSASIETRTKMGVIAAENILAGLKNENMPDIVNPEVQQK